MKPNNIDDAKDEEIRENIAEIKGNYTLRKIMAHGTEYLGMFSLGAGLGIGIVNVMAKENYLPLYYSCILIGCGAFQYVQGRMLANFIQRKEIFEDNMVINYIMGLEKNSDLEDKVENDEIR